MNKPVLMHGDCLELMKEIPNGSVDLVITDLPYGITKCKWDSVIPLEPMWEQVKRISKERTAILLFSAEPFTSMLVMSNPKMFKYDIIYEKTRASGFLNAKRMPLRSHENILVFYSKLPTYNSIKEPGEPYEKHEISDGQTKVYGDFKRAGTVCKNSGYRMPRSVIKFSNNNYNSMHPAQKPVALLEYLIKTYSDEGDTVLDFTMGSGSTGVACANTGRNFIGIEIDGEYFETARKRIDEALREQSIWPE